MLGGFCSPVDCPVHTETTRKPSSNNPAAIVLTRISAALRLSAHRPASHKDDNSRSKGCTNLETFGVEEVGPNLTPAPVRRYPLVRTTSAFILAPQEAAYGFPLCSLASDCSVRRHRLRRQLYHVHAAAVPPQRLPQASRRGQASRRFARRWFDARPLSFPFLYPQRDEVARRDRKIQARTRGYADRVSQWSTRHAQVPRDVVCLLPHHRFLRRLSHRSHRRARRSLSRRLPRSGHCGVPRLRPGTSEQRHLEGPALGNDPEGSHRRPHLRFANRRHLWLALAPLAPPVAVPRRVQRRETRCPIQVRASLAHISSLPSQSTHRQPLTFVAALPLIGCHRGQTRSRWRPYLQVRPWEEPAQTSSDSPH